MNIQKNGKKEMIVLGVVLSFLLLTISFFNGRQIKASFLNHSRYTNAEIMYYQLSGHKQSSFNLKARYVDSKGVMEEANVYVYLRYYRDTINFISKKIFILEDTLREKYEVLLCPSSAQEYQVPYDTFVKYCGDTLFWKDRCEEDWYYYK